MSNRKYTICPECQGKGSVERELRSRTMNSGGFMFIDVECPRCGGEGEVVVDDPFARLAEPLLSIRESIIDEESVEVIR